MYEKLRFYPFYKGIFIFFILILGVSILLSLPKGDWVNNILSLPKKQEKQKIQVKKIVIQHDQNHNGILDLEEIIQGARKDALNKSVYRSAYYQEGYPPEAEGVCTDVIWRAFKNSGYDLKLMVDQDIQ